jgi:thioredoxin-like negative regulator of GroEL
MNAVALSMLLQSVLLTGGAEPYDQAFKKAEENGQPLLVLVGADWCPGCVTMKNGVLARMSSGGKLKRVNFAHVNTDESPTLASKLMSGKSIPQLVVYSKTETGWHRDLVIGAVSEAEVESLINRAVSVAAKPKDEPEAVNR